MLSEMDSPRRSPFKGQCLQKVQQYFHRTELSLGMCDALQRNNHLEVLRSLQFSLERHNTQRHVINCVAWPNPSCENRPAIVYQARYTLDRTSLHTARDCFQPTHARARLLFSILNYYFRWQTLPRQLASTFPSLNTQFPFD
jgi:hypothetical protein